MCRYVGYFTLCVVMLIISNNVFSCLLFEMKSCFLQSSSHILYLLSFMIKVEKGFFFLNIWNARGLFWLKLTPTLYIVCTTSVARRYMVSFISARNISAAKIKQLQTRGMRTANHTSCHSHSSYLFLLPHSPSPFFLRKKNASNFVQSLAWSVTSLIPWYDEIMSSLENSFQRLPKYDLSGRVCQVPDLKSLMSTKAGRRFAGAQAAPSPYRRWVDQRLQLMARCDSQ